MFGLETESMRNQLTQHGVVRSVRCFSSFVDWPLTDQSDPYSEPNGVSWLRIQDRITPDGIAMQTKLANGPSDRASFSQLRPVTGVAGMRNAFLIEKQTPGKKQELTRHAN